MNHVSILIMYVPHNPLLSAEYDDSCKNVNKPKNGLWPNAEPTRLATVQ